MKIILVAIGIISLTLGVIGIFLPVLPTTPFVLLSAFLFSKSSKKFHTFLLNHKVFGPIIKDFYEKRGIKKKNKVISIAAIVICAAISLYVLPVLHAKIVLIVILSFVVVYILRLKTLS